MLAISKALSSPKDSHIRNARLLLPGFAAALLLMTSASAKTFKVPSASFPTIQSAIDASVGPSDTVLVSKGTYLETVEIDKPITLKGKGKNVIIDAAPFTNGILVHDCIFGVFIENMIVTGGTTGSTSGGIRVINCEFVSIDHCVVKDSGGDGIVFDKSDACGVLHSTIENVAGFGIRVFNPANGGTFFSIEKNVIDNAGVLGIDIDGAGVEIKKNHIKSCSAGIIGRGAKVEIGHNFVEDCASSGIETLEIGAKIKKNHCVSCDLGNFPDVAAIRVGGSSTTVAENYVADSENGILIRTYADNCEIRKNTVKNIHASGVLVHGDYNVISACQATHTGFVIGGSHNTMKHCAAHHSLSSGFVVDEAGGSDNEVMDCHAFAPNGHGFVCGYYNEFVDCSCDEAKHSGFQLAGASHCTFDHCRASGSGDWDLTDPDVESPPETNTFVNCSFGTKWPG